MSKRKRLIDDDDRVRALVSNILDEKRNDWGLGQEQVERAVDIIVLDNIHSHHPLRLFLYAKGILFDDSSSVRIAKYENLLNPDASHLSKSIIEKLERARERLVRIVEFGEKGKVGKLTIFEEFVSDHPEWSSANSFVLFRDHALFSGKKHAYVERIQMRSGLCYMNAPVVMQHYLVTMQRNDHVPMLDMGLYLCQVMNSDDLFMRIWDNRGGDSKAFLEHILIQEPEPVFSSHNCEDDLASLMDRYGPGLVQGFKVEDEFCNSIQWQHLGARGGPSTGLHAMVLVGHRKEGDDNRYLLQNWWKSKPFVEVDAKYLKTCGAIIHFVETPQYEMGSFPINLHDHVECDFLDAPETFSQENKKD
jgi:hypothetical protein